MDSDFQQQQYQHHFQDPQRQFHNPKQQMNSLTRFRSAPSSYFENFLDAAADSIPSTGGGGGSGGGEFSNARPLSPETENIISRFISSVGAKSNSSSQKLCDIPENSSVQPGFTARVKQETDTLHQQQQQQQQQQHGNYNTQPQMIYHSQSKLPLANQQNSASVVSSAMERSFRGIGATSMGMDSLPQMKIDGDGSNNNGRSILTRHSSSPAGFFSNLNIDTTGYGMMGGIGNYGGGSGGNGQVNFSSGQPSSVSGVMTQNSDVGEMKSMTMTSLDERRFSNSSSNHHSDSSYGFPMSSWDDSILSEHISSLDRVGDDGRNTYPELNTSENQSGEGRNHPPLLAHHLSLPKTLPEMSAMENFLQFQDTVPCRTRAKRGCATHPRSIAERVRRTRISERMRKLQDLVPNMDKQTNTSDMLDLAVEYIKDLQKQVKILTDNRAKCTCSR